MCHVWRCSKSFRITKISLYLTRYREEFPTRGGFLWEFLHQFLSDYGSYLMSYYFMVRALYSPLLYYYYRLFQTFYTLLTFRHMRIRAVVFTFLGVGRSVRSTCKCGSHIFLWPLYFGVRWICTSPSGFEVDYSLDGSIFYNFNMYEKFRFLDENTNDETNV